MHPYPHLKLTKETFPRLLATRRLAADGSEYFGAFLGRTSVRIMIDFLNRIFRLRSCDIIIDGSFSVPCTQYFSRRCTGPCCVSLCSESEYERQADLPRLFLRNDRDGFRSEIRRRIESLSSNLEFEKAAELRDIFEQVGAFWQNPRRRVWLDDTVDTYRFGTGVERGKLFLISRRGRRILGSHIFEGGEGGGNASLSLVLGAMYRFYAPREIRVPDDFESRRELSRRLSERFGREIKIKVAPENSLGVSEKRALQKSRNELALKRIGSSRSFFEPAKRLQEIFRLPVTPRLIEAYDAAHISATGFVAARIVHDISAGRTAGFEYRQSAAENEPSALADLALRRYSADPAPRADLILVDGGKPQLNSVVRALENVKKRHFSIISAVKPPSRHSEISHFLTENGDRIEFDPSDGGHRLLLAIRDEVHELANSVHRLSRDMAAFYEPAEILPSLDEAARRSLLARSGSIRRIIELSNQQIDQIFESSAAKAVIRDIENYRAGKYRRVPPLIVPTRFDEPDGDGEDLRPILTAL